MKARAIPVADAGDVADLDPNLAVRLVEHRGEWANVLSADGWSGWVEARHLRPEPDSA
jgi:SH3-like domain-containing protein